MQRITIFTGSFILLLFVFMMSCEDCETILLDVLPPDSDPVDTTDTFTVCPAFEKILYFYTDGEHNFQAIENDFQDDLSIAVEGNIPNSFFNNDLRPSNGSAYSKTLNQYVFIAPIEQILMNYNPVTQTGVELDNSPLELKAAPVFLNDLCYTLQVNPNGFSTPPNGGFDILEIDPSIGFVNNFVSNGNFNLNSTFNIESVSSATDGFSEVAFLSGTNLIIYDVVSNQTNTFDLDPSFSSSNFIKYFGLENLGVGSWLALKQFPSGMSLVSLNINGISVSENEIVDIGTSFPTPQIDLLNTEYYSSTIDSCKFNYYVVSRADNGPLRSNLFEIDLTQKSIRTWIIEDVFVQGIHFVEK